MIVLLFGVMYFMMIRPQQKRRREAEQMQRSLTVGDEVVTIGGLHGTVVEVGDDVVAIEIAPGVHARYSRPAIAKVLPRAEPAAETTSEQVVDGSDAKECPDADTPSRRRGVGVTGKRS